MSHRQRWSHWYWHVFSRPVPHVVRDLARAEYYKTLTVELVRICINRISRSMGTDVRIWEIPAETDVRRTA